MNRKDLSYIAISERVPKIDTEIHPRRMLPSAAPAQTRTKFDKHGEPILYYFSRREFKLLTLLAELFITPTDGVYHVPCEDVAFNIDRFIALNRSTVRFFVRVLLFLWQIHTIFFFKPPFSWLGKETQKKYVRRIFKNARGFIAFQLSKIKQLIYLGYYTDPRSDVQTGFKAFNETAREAAIIRAEMLAQREAEKKRLRRRKTKTTDELKREKK